MSVVSLISDISQKRSNDKNMKKIDQLITIEHLFLIKIYFMIQNHKIDKFIEIFYTIQDT